MSALRGKLRINATGSFVGPYISVENSVREGSSANFRSRQ
jgi:hypothetical protein